MLPLLSLVPQLDGTSRKGPSPSGPGSTHSPSIGMMVSTTHWHHYVTCDLYSQEAGLATEAAALAGELARVQAEAREAEAALRSKKKSSEKEVADWLAEYDRDMAQRDKENRDNKVSRLPPVIRCNRKGWLFPRKVWLPARKLKTLILDGFRMTCLAGCVPSCSLAPIWCRPSGPVRPCKRSAPVGMDTKGLCLARCRLSTGTSRRSCAATRPTTSGCRRR